MTQRSRANLESQINLLVNTNGIGEITAADVRSVLTDVADSCFNLTSDASTSNLTNGHILVGNLSNVATDVAVSGDITITNAGVTAVSKIAGTAVSGTSGSGNVAFTTSPVFTTPNIGSATGSISGNAATVTTNANLTGPITSSGNATSVASQTGTGTKFVMDTSPTLVTPNLGTPTAGSLGACINLPISTGVSGLGSNIATFLGSPSSSNFTAAVTDFLSASKAYTGQQYFAEATLTDASPITWNLNTQQAAYVLLTSGIGATRQLQNPTNIQNGATYTLVVQQSSTGSNALTYGTSYKFPGGAAFVLSTANNAIDILTFIAHNSLMYGVGQWAFS